MAWDRFMTWINVLLAELIYKKESSIADTDLLKKRSKPLVVR